MSDHQKKNDTKWLLLHKKEPPSSLKQRFKLSVDLKERKKKIKPSLLFLLLPITLFL